MYYLTANFTLSYCFFIAADETEALVPRSNRLINTYSAPSQYVWHTPHPLLCFPFMKSTRVPYFSSYSCHWQTKSIHVPVLLSVQKGILVFLFTEVLLQVCCVCIYVWGGGTHCCTLLKNFKRITAAHFSADWQINTEEIIQFLNWTYKFKLRFTFLLRTASIATAVNSDLTDSKDCLRWR